MLPYDWRGFFQTRVYEITEHAPLGGIENGGWRLVYNDKPNPVSRTRENVDGRADLSFSLGIIVETAKRRRKRTNLRT